MPPCVQMLGVPLTVSVFLLSVASSSGLRANLMVHLDYRCGNNPAVCENIPERTCCVPPESLREFNSAKCGGCERIPAPFSYFLWSREGDQVCGKIRISTGAELCMSSQSSNGYSWCKCPPPYPGALAGSSEANEGALRCTSMVEPNLLNIDGKWFKVNSSIPKDDKMALWNLWGNNASAANIPEQLLQYMVPKPDYI